MTRYLIILLLAVGGAYGQNITGSIIGSVADSTGLAVASAR